MITRSIPREKFERTPPLNFRNQDEHLFELKKEIIVPEFNFYKIDNCSMQEDGSVWIGAELFSPSLRIPSEMEKAYSFFKKLKRKCFFKKNYFEDDKTYVSIVDYWSGEYYHWLIEACARLAMMKKEIGDFTLVLSPRQNSAFHRRSLELFGIKDIVWVEDKSINYFKSLQFCDFPGPPDIHRPEAIKALREFLGKDLTFSKDKKIYLSRQKAKKRKIINEQEVEQFLHSEGFVTVYAEDLSFDQQRELFSKTKILVTVHGAGLTNLIFMPEGARVIELRKNVWGLAEDGQRETTKFYNTYYHLAQILNIEYSYLACPASDDDLTAHWADLRVDVGELAKRFP